MLDLIEDMVSSKYYMLFYVAILVFSFFQGKIASWYVVRRINKLMSSRYVVAEFRDELINKAKLKDKYTEYYNCIIKVQIYFVLGLASLGQIIGLLVAHNLERIGLNLCTLTMTLAFIEFRDNRLTSKRMGSEIDNELSEIIQSYVEVETMAIEDIALDRLVKEKYITKEKRAELIKRSVLM